MTIILSFEVDAALSHHVGSDYAGPMEVTEGIFDVTLPRDLKELIRDLADFRNVHAGHKIEKFYSSNKDGSLFGYIASSLETPQEVEKRIVEHIRLYERSNGCTINTEYREYLRLQSIYGKTTSQQPAQPTDLD